MTEEDAIRMNASFQRKVITFNIRAPVMESVKGLPCVKLANAPAAEFFDLCDKHFGDNWIWSSSMFNEHTLVFFKDQADALMFRLLVNYATA